MAVEDCNVKKSLKSLIGLTRKSSRATYCYFYTGRNVEHKTHVKRKEEALWTVYLSMLNSPYVTSSKTARNDLKGDEIDGENGTYNELMRKAFCMKMQGRNKSGLEMEEKAEFLISQRFDHRLIKFLLCLSNIEDGNTNQQGIPDFYHRFANFGQLGHEMQLEHLHSNWINFDVNDESVRQQRFFHFELAPSWQSGSSNIFQSKPGSHFLGNFSSHIMNENTAESKGRSGLFGALSNPYSQDTLDMVLSLPDMSHDSLSLKSNLISIDEGFIDETPSSISANSEVPQDSCLNDELQIWTDCLSSKWQICHTWEKLTKFWNKKDSSKYLTESGSDAFDHLCQMRQHETVYLTNEINMKRSFSMDILVRHSVNVLCGLPSDVFIFNKAKCCFVVEASVHTPGLSSEATRAILEKFGEIGTCYRQLSRFTQNHSERSVGLSGGLTLESFITSLRKYLDLYKCAVLIVQENMPTDFLKLWATFVEFGAQLRFLAEICLCSAAFCRTRNTPRPRFPMGLKLISYLYDLCSRNESTTHSGILLHLFKDTCIPFLRYISKWIFDGRCHDPYNEFIIAVDDQYLCYRDKHYWTHGFVLKESRNDIMMFDHDFVEQIYACGKALNLLKQANIHHYLLQNDLHPPQIKLLLSASEIEQVQNLSQEYEKRVIEARSKGINEKMLQMKEEMRRKREEIAVERENHHKMIQNMNELERKVKEAIKMKKLKELQGLKEQMENAIEKRKAEKEKLILEDKEFLKQETLIAEERDEMERKAREELLSYYDELTQQAVARENRALWAIKRYELHSKRKEFIIKEQLWLDEETEKLKVIASEEIDSSERSSIENNGGEYKDNYSASWKSEEDRLKFDEKVNEHRNNEEFGDEKEEENSGVVKNEILNDFAIEHSDEASKNEGKVDVRNEDHSDVTDDHNKADLRIEEKDYDEAKSQTIGDDSSNQSTSKNRKLWDIEPVSSYQSKTLMKSILYPGEFNNSIEVPTKSSRGKEPQVTIKDLIYHQEMPEKDFDLPTTPWTQSELNYDVTYEYQQDSYKRMTNTPQPYLLDSLLNETHFQYDDEDDETDVIKYLSLEIILHRSLVVPIASQIKLVQTAAVEYMMDSLQIGMHFDAFRKYLLLEDGEFGLSLCNQIFEKAFGSMLTPKEFCNPAILNSIINQALHFSLFADKLELSRKLSFSLKFIPEFFNSTDVNALDFLQLKYKVPWPCNIIITENSIAKYNKVFNFLVRLKMVNWALRKVWHNLKRAGRLDKSKLSPQIRKLQLFRHEMQHFVNNIERYLVNQIIHISWKEFQDDLRNNVHNIDDLHKYHVNYLNRIIFRSLLNKNAAPVLKIISDIFTLVLKFHYQLLSSDWEENQDGFNEHQRFSSLSSIYNGFKQYAQFLFKVVSKLIRRGYQNHLDHLLLQVNFNGCYDYETL